MRHSLSPKIVAPWGFALVLILSCVRGEAAQLPDFTDLIQDVSPAVVNISTTQKIKSNQPQFPHGNAPDMPEGGPFEDFLRRFFGEDPRGYEEYDVNSLGSGFIISAEGYVLSNYHVVEDADQIIVRLSDRREIEAKVIGTDKRSDIALLKIEAENLPVVKIGDSSALRVGEWVVAIGSPFGFDHSATAGIVSAMGRSLPSENYVPFIQTDVAINPGNSGGPLFNMRGEVIGVNSQIYSRTGGYMGLSFAIPIGLAMNVVDQLKTTGRVARGWLGVLIQDVTRDLAESFKIQKPVGALVSRVLPGSPAEKAGFQVSDIIVEFDGKPVVSSSALPPMVGSADVGRTIEVKVIRDGKPRKLRVTIGELPSEEELASVGEASGEQRLNVSRLDLVVGGVPEGLREELNLSGSGGVVVMEVAAGPARAAGIREGDVIAKINNHDVKDATHFKALVDDLAPGQSVPVLVQRRGGPMFIAVKIPEK